MKKKKITKPTTKIRNLYTDLAKIYLASIKPKTHIPNHDSGNLDNLKDIQFWIPNLLVHN